MRIYPRHDWDLGYAEAVALQKELAGEVRLRSLPLASVRRVAGADIAVSKAARTAAAAVVVLEFPSLAVVEERVARGALEFPYIPGLLSFREIPVLIECLRKIETPFDALLCDGQGIAHPRRFGLASHLGLILRKPTIGCAKSLLVGEYGAVGESRGDFAPLVCGGKRVGSVLRTQDGVKPIFVSPGHLVDHRSSRRIALLCAARCRIPEPTRRADRLAGEERRRIDSLG
ncbi:MAG: endonuclease [Candidatus Krumholzibacteriota bacterium]|nr:endonuclease [Candidatus Krumholzibacteriota bacterium]